MDDLDDIWTGFRSQTGAIRQEMSALRAIERALVRAISQGKMGFEDLKRVALSVMAEIARSAIQAGIGAILGGGKSGGGNNGLVSLAQAAVMSLAGSPGRATGGPVSGGRAYLVGERGPEYFVPTSSGRIEPIGGGARPVAITINLHGAGGQDPQRMMQSGRQIARAVRRAMMQGED
ncbi:tail tape measure protein [Sphingopyxis yananensis]|uniref:tail tape measure protein n=1 Tax=Sphingopyxis yananensis TaxID=2886687 RepID=UPI001D119B14|nr:tail tape measure protein [Sphingopyxis yananensis]MCC2601707.1 tail tape measure protein [Sphingopyxis yananensis]